MQVCFSVPDREGSIIGYREKQVFTVGRYLGMAGGAIMLLGIPYGLDPLAPFLGGKICGIGNILGYGYYRATAGEERNNNRSSSHRARKLGKSLTHPSG